MDYRLLALDIDGTTIRDDGTLHPHDVAAIEAAQREGIIVTLITGRLFTGTRHIARKLKIQGTVGVMNGSELRDVEAGSTLEGDYLDSACRNLCRDALQNHDLRPFLFASDDLHHGRCGEPYLSSLRAWTRQFVAHEDLFLADHWHTANDILAVVAIGDEENVAAARAALEPHVPDTVEILTFSGFKVPVHFLKVRSRIEDKGTALRRIAAETGLDVSQCVAVGDWFNDLPMLKVAGRSFAMGQAHDHVKQSATDVLSATSEQGGGVAEVVKGLWGLRF
jgi:Cof subfamily protein (haloacid dehalogenase superfamily)